MMPSHSQLSKHIPLDVFGGVKGVKSIVISYLSPDFDHVRAFCQSKLGVKSAESQDEVIARLREMWENSGECGKAEVKGRKCKEHKDQCCDYDFDFTMSGIIFGFSDFPPWMTGTDSGYEATMTAIRDTTVVDDLREAFFKDIGTTVKRTKKRRRE